MRRRHTPKILVSAAVLVASLLYAHFKTLPPATLPPTPSSSTSTVIMASTTSENSTYRVAKVVDGDTVELIMQGKKVKIRLIGLNTPETVAPNRPVGCYGPEASAEAHRLLDNKAVRLEVDPTQGTYDKYGRSLGYIFLEDGTNFGLYMIKAGFGKEDTYKKPYKYQKEFKEAQAQAQAQKLGEWGACM